MSERITITRPDDWHLHVRDGDFLKAVLPDTVKRFARAIIMPNLKPPVISVAQAKAYYDRIMASLPAGASFTPLMTLYLTENSRVEEMELAKQSGFVQAVKYYPAGATTNSDSGVRQWGSVEAVLEAMEQLGLPLLVHGEVTDPHVDVFDRERVFIEEELIPLVLKYPKLKVVLEHITTASAVKFVLTAGSNVAATVTAHHLLLNRNALFQGGIRPHHYCLPVLKRETHRQALLEAVISGNPKFFLGTDSAPHAQNVKENACGCAGIYTAHAAIELYAEAFESVGALDKLEGFASFYGADFYGLARNKDQITIEKQQVKVPLTLPYGSQSLVPMRSGEYLIWSLVA
ncbi:MAG: dihydroorotase [Ferrovum sp. 37-45-19]|uniref:dihydroorotase n=1 Tax=Ferrovum sp. JA12 TaxID=1356299 RepID=UPI0007030EA4|nr:dihydroorotase [Ferrovum sp. JA12]OYV80640.1 MAG: dihydroorotase [Ferrovum sp. 21-44-67]OYV95191.1 MAG: dihydroorotase [Ferrovum sp. 37-45-19]OZB33785.1 MAG: dihydroorotase [Ferrovum sp. 34-44-207]HQT80690.1 dihydroorotase [Ferrovaceae bacterium]KRH79782.1 dihydroorotase [Ferrovum sp. JA12]